MRSVADDLRGETAAHVLAMTPRERSELAFALGEHDLRMLMRAQALTRTEALVRIRASRRAGRRPSVVNEP